VPVSLSWPPRLALVHQTSHFFFLLIVTGRGRAYAMRDARRRYASHIPTSFHMGHASNYPRPVLEEITPQLFILIWHEAQRRVREIRLLALPPLLAALAYLRKSCFFQFLSRISNKFLARLRPPFSVTPLSEQFCRPSSPDFPIKYPVLLGRAGRRGWTPLHKRRPNLSHPPVVTSYHAALRVSPPNF